MSNINAYVGQPILSRDMTALMRRVNALEYGLRDGFWLDTVAEDTGWLYGCARSGTGGGLTPGGLNVWGPLDAEEDLENVLYCGGSAWAIYNTEVSLGVGAILVQEVDAETGEAGGTSWYLTGNTWAPACSDQTNELLYFVHWYYDPYPTNTTWEIRAYDLTGSLVHTYTYGSSDEPSDVVMLVAAPDAGYIYVAERVISGGLVTRFPLDLASRTVIHTAASTITSIGTNGTDLLIASPLAYERRNSSGILQESWSFDTTDDFGLATGGVVYNYGHPIIYYDGEYYVHALGAGVSPCVAVYDASTKAFKRLVHNPVAQTVFYSYWRDGGLWTATPLGTPDGGVSVPEDNALCDIGDEETGSLVSPNIVADIREAIETLAGRFANPATGLQWNWEAEEDAEDHNLYHEAMTAALADGRSYGLEDIEIGYDWVRTASGLEGDAMVDLDAGEMAECIALLEASAA